MNSLPYLRKQSLFGDGVFWSNRFFRQNIFLQENGREHGKRIHMQIEFQFNSMVVSSEQDLDGIVGGKLFVVPCAKSLRPQRKSVRRRRTKKGRTKVATVIDDLIKGIRQE